jgi:hypothetical protein
LALNDGEKLCCARMRVRAVHAAYRKVRRMNLSLCARSTHMD